MQNIFPEHKSEIVLGNGKFQLDPMSYTVIYEEKEISLAPREFEVLYLFSTKTKLGYSKEEYLLFGLGE